MRIRDIAGDRFRPEIVLLDLDMPRMDGFEVARHLSGCHWMDDAQLIAYTGFGDPRYRSAAIAAGFDEFIMKPVALEQLLRILRNQGQELVGRSDRT